MHILTGPEEPAWPRVAMAIEKRERSVIVPCK
jgi:hypothetical protein